MKTFNIKKALLFLGLFFGLFFCLLSLPRFLFAQCPDKFKDLSERDFRSSTLKEPAKNLILIIGDGFGPVQLEAAFPNKKTIFSNFPHVQKITHCSLSGVTDSAAAATSMATGYKTHNKKIAVSEKNEPLKSILEIVKAKGKKTGLVTNTEITHATPAAFGAHTINRHNHVLIARDYLMHSRSDILLGGGRKYFEKLGYTKQDRKKIYVWHGYHVALHLKALRNLVEQDSDSMQILGLFSNGHMDFEKKRKELRNRKREPSLSQMTRQSLEFLSDSPKGFFLMIEGGRIDHAGHANRLDLLIPEVREFERTVSLVYQWVQNNRHTLLLVTADHETGGLTRKGGNFHWTTPNHTATPVYLWGLGPNADTIKNASDNRAVFHILHQALVPQNRLRD